MDYDRYQSYANVSFMEEQLGMLRKSCPNHFITTNNVGLVDTIDMRDLFRNLDFASNDNYPGFFSVVFNSPDSGMSLSPEMMTPIISMGHDFMRSVKDGKPFLVMEEQSGKAGQPFFSPQPEPGQLRLWSYQAVAHGAMGINYFRWDTTNFGAEEYWHGILRHDRSPSPGYEEIKRTMQELKSLGEEALNAKYAAELGLCFDPASSWAFTIQPGQPKVKYFNEVVTWYGSIAASHAGVDLVNATQDLSAYKIVFAPAMYIVSAKQAEQIRAFVQNGGTFIAGFRLGAKDEHSRMVDTPLPGLLRDVMGVELIDYQPVYSDKQGVEVFRHVGRERCGVPHLGGHSRTEERGGAGDLHGRQVRRKSGDHSHSFGKGKAIYVGVHLEPADSGARVTDTDSGKRSKVGDRRATRSGSDRSW